MCIKAIRPRAVRYYLDREATTLRGFLKGLPSGVNVLAGSLNGVVCVAILGLSSSSLFFK